MFTLDHFNGFHQLKLQRNLRRHCCFRWEGRIYRWRVLPFGLSVAPRTYTKIMRLLLKRWRALGIRCSGYIDDSIFFAETVEEAERIRDIVLRDMERFGLTINARKAALTPSQCVAYLGYLFDASGEPRLFVPEDKLQRVRDGADELLSELQADPGAKFSGRRVAQLVGRILAMRYAVGPARVATRELLAALRGLKLTGPRKRQVRDYDSSVALHEGAQLELLFWRERAADWNGLVWAAATPDLVLYTDACTGGWGALAVDVKDGREGDIVDWEQGLHPQQLSTHSIRTEVHALLQALLTMGEAWRGKVVRHRTDSTGTYYGLCNGGFATAALSDLNDLVRRVWMTACLREIKLQPEYVGKEVIIRSGADQLSRETAEDGLQLRRSVFEGLARRWGWPTIDLFASRVTVQRREDGSRLEYYSRLPDSAARGCDALVHEWEGSCYAFPPPFLAWAAVEKALRSTARTILVLPDWEAQPWYPLLLERCGEEDQVVLGRAEKVAKAVESDEAPAVRLRAWYVRPL